jgi:hypothetical protein
MQAILDFFTNIWTVVNQLISFVIGLVEDLVYVVRLTGQFVANIPTYFSWLPPAALAILVSIFGIVVIYKIIGREG